MTKTETFQEYVLSKIEECGSQQALAAKVGCSQASISKYKSNNQRPSHDLLCRFQSAFGEINNTQLFEYRLAQQDIEAIADAVVRKLGLAAISSVKA